jgi:uncharacterized protein YdeI (YjbR/CyaY-like superfamily)
MRTVGVRTRAAWRAWLAKHHATVSEVWLVFHKIHTGRRSMDYEAAVEEALCFGWVDSLIKRLDEDRYARKFTPRKADSAWSPANRRRYARMKAAGRLAAAGMKRPPTARDPYAELPDVSTVPADVIRALKAAPNGWASFQRLAPSHRRRYLLWIGTAKREDTRQRRIAGMVRLLLQGKALGLGRTPLADGSLVRLKPDATVATRAPSSPCAGGPARSTADPPPAPRSGSG